MYGHLESSGKEVGPLGPGHTDHHLSYLVDDGDGPPAVFTGGSLLYGSVGRTDLVDPARTEEMTRAQYRSARRLGDPVPDDAAVHPTHGFGSCSSGSSAGGSAAPSVRNASATTRWSRATRTRTRTRSSPGSWPA